MRDGARGRARTCDLLIRSQTLYPTELRVRIESQFACKMLCTLYFGTLCFVLRTWYVLLQFGATPRLLLFSHEVQSLDYEMLITKSKALSTKY